MHISCTRLHRFCLASEAVLWWWWIAITSWWHHSIDRPNKITTVMMKQTNEIQAVSICTLFSCFFQSSLDQPQTPPPETASLRRFKTDPIVLPPDCKSPDNPLKCKLPDYPSAASGVLCLTLWPTSYQSLPKGCLRKEKFSLYLNLISLRWKNI